MLLTSSSSKTIIRENFSRYWAIPVLSLFAYILVGLLPVIMNYKSFDIVSSYAASFITGSGFVPNLVIAATSVIASSAVFGYLHDPVSANMIHSMPANRKKLFASAVFSGWLFVVLPVIVISFLFLTMRGATLSPGFITENAEITSYITYAGPADEVFTAGHSLVCIVNCLVTASFVYATCCLAAVLSGRKVIHVLLAMFLIVLPVTIVAMVRGILAGFLYGFSSNFAGYIWLSPIAYAMSLEYFSIGFGYIVYYLLLTAAILAVSYVVYSKVRIERVGSASTFPLVADALCIILTFMLGLGLAELIVDLIGTSSMRNVRFMVTAFITSAIFYVIMRMIADSTPAVFNIATLRKAGVYFAILAVFLALTAADATGYQKRVPDASEVESVSLETNLPSEAITADTVYTDPGMIKAVIGLHKALVDTKDVEPKDLEASYECSITWKLRNGRTMTRVYEERFGKNFEPVKAAAKAVYDQEQFRDHAVATIAANKGITERVNIYGIGDYDDETGAYEMTAVKEEDRDALFDVIAQDFKARSFEEMQSDEWIISVDVYRKEGTYDEAADDEGFLSYVIKDCDSRTIKYLKDKGYYDKLNIQPW